MFISPPSLEFKHPIKKRFIWWSARRHFKMKEVCWSQKVLVFWTGSAEFVLCQGYSRNINSSQIQIRKSRNSNMQILCVFWFQLWRYFQFDWKLLLGTHTWDWAQTNPIKNAALPQRNITMKVLVTDRSRPMWKEANYVFIWCHFLVMNKDNKMTYHLWRSIR